MSEDIARDVGAAAMKAAPPLAVWSLTANDWLALAAIAYTILQAAHLIWKWRREVRRQAEIDRIMQGRVADYNEKAPK